MPDQTDIALMAHLMRRAGFGASRDEIEERADRGYDAVVDELLDPESQPALAQLYWLYHMTHTSRPLQEKMALFWHQVFATGVTKVQSPVSMMSQLELFRGHGLGSYRALLGRLGREARGQESLTQLPEWSGSEKSDNPLPPCDH